jgi:hypothetical protein
MVSADVISNGCGIIATLNPNALYYRHMMDELNYFARDKRLPKVPLARPPTATCPCALITLARSSPTWERVLCAPPPHCPGLAARHGVATV